jgi:hypothetical protein
MIHACYSATTSSGVPVTTGGANLTIIDPSAGQACVTTSSLGAATAQREITWNQSGPQGPTGPGGAQGAPGSTGSPGKSGPQGPAVTVAGGHTLTLAGGQVLTVGGGAGVTINNPPPNLGRSVAHVTFGTGAQAMSFDIAELNFATGAHGSGGGGGAGKVAVHDISITKHVDKASPTLFKYCANGQHIKQGTITLRKAGKTYLTIKLTDVLISSYQTGGSAHADQPTESLSLNFTKVQYIYSK